MNTSPPSTSRSEAVRPPGQFSLRQLLLFTLAASVVAALVAPWVRRLEPALGQLIALHLGIASVSGGAMGTRLCLKRRKTLLQAGRQRLRIRSPFGQKWWSRHLVYFGWCCHTGVLLVICVLSPLSRSQSSSPVHDFYTVWLPIVCSISFGANLATPTLDYWWRLLPTTIEVCEQGLISGGTWFLSWSDISRWSLTGKQKPRLVIFAKGNVSNVAVAPELVDQVEQLFAEYLTPEAKPAAATAASPNVDA